MKVAIILPTYNEKENIERIINNIFHTISDVEIIAIDDNSPDGTGQILDKLAKANANLKVMHRYGKRGRGTAGIEGFKHALAKGADYIIEMDADLSHNPKYIPLFIDKMKEADIVIGSRFIKGGHDNERNIIRRIISILANSYIKIMMGIPNVKDCTSGYRCFKRQVLESIPFDDLRSKGPSIVTEILYNCRKFKIKEIPIIFKARHGGNSKFNFKAMSDNLLLALKLRLNKLIKNA